MISMYDVPETTDDVPSSSPEMKGDITNKIIQLWYCSPVTTPQGNRSLKNYLLTLISLQTNFLSAKHKMRALGFNVVLYPNDPNDLVYIVVDRKCKLAMMPIVAIIHFWEN